MVNKIWFTEEHAESRKMLFKEADLRNLPDKRIVPLFGPNGAGKTTLLSCLKTTLETELIAKHLSAEKDEWTIRYFEEESKKQKASNGCGLEKDDRNFRVLSYINSEDNYRNRTPRSYREACNLDFISAGFDAKAISEGQSILYSVYGLFETVRKTQTENDLVVLIDELDSGLSIDNIDTCMRKMKNILAKRDNVQIIFSFNNPRVLKFFQYVISMYDGKVYEMHSDDDMMSEIRKNKKWFDKIRKKSNGEPKVYDED